MSSPCFLRVADASAASIASNMMSFSTPFSFETASTTIKISLLISVKLQKSPVTRTKASCRFGYQPGRVDHRQRQAVRHAINLDYNILVIRRQQFAAKSSAPLQ